MADRDKAGEAEEENFRDVTGGEDGGGWCNMRRQEIDPLW